MLNKCSLANSSFIKFLTRLASAYFVQVCLISKICKVCVTFSRFSVVVVLGAFLVGKRMDNGVTC